MTSQLFATDEDITLRLARAGANHFTLFSNVSERTQQHEHDAVLGQQHPLETSWRYRATIYAMHETPKGLYLETWNKLPYIFRNPRG